MIRTTRAVLALGSVLTLAACSSHSSTAAPAGGATTPPPATTSASTPATAPVSVAPSATAGTPSATGAASAAPSTTVPATATSPGSKPAPTTTTSAGSSTRCLNSHLKVTLKPGSPGAGQIYSSLVFSNTGPASCTLAGHPGVSYVAGDKGVQVGKSATRDAGTVTTVTLAVGGSASALLHETNYQNFDEAVCKPVDTRGLRVYPPGSTAAVFIARPAKQCSGTALPNPALSIGVVKAGTGD
jgi:Protein of unknown function (DUF4232)